MGDNGRIDIEKCISYSRDLAVVLKNKKDANHLMQSLEGAKRLQSYCEADFHELKNSLLDYQKRINACKQRIDDAKAEVLSDKDLDSLQNELEEELKKGSLLMEELSNQLGDLERQSSSVEDQRQILKKCDKDVVRAQSNLKMYILVSKILPTTDEPTKISGCIVDKVKETVEKFEFDPANTSSFNICNSLWKMIDS